VNRSSSIKKRCYSCQNSLGHDHNQSFQVLRPRNKVLLLYDIAQVPGQQASRLLLLQALQRRLDVVVDIRLALQVIVDQRHLLGNGLGNRLEWLLDRVLGIVPVELGHIGEAVNVVAHQVLG